MASHSKNLYMPIPNGHNNLSRKDIVTGYTNNVMEYIKAFLRYRRRYRNYISVIYHVLKKKYPLTAVLKDGKQVQFFHQEQIWLDLAGISYAADKDIVYIHDFQVLGGTSNGDIVSIFSNKNYGLLPVKGRVVIDIGANIADSSIYFLSQGAKKVYGVEPNRQLYNLAKQNVDHNNLSDRLTLIWAGCSSKTDNNTNPPFLSLDEMIKKYDITPDILKVDCEGCEYDVILNSTNSLIGSFSCILVEYHHGYRNIKRKLERCGFQVKVTGPTYHSKSADPSNLTIYFCSHPDIIKVDKIYAGYIFASKKSVPKNNVSLC